VRREPGSDKWIWLEYDSLSGFDETLSRYTANVFGGALVHYEDAVQPSSATLGTFNTYLLDFTPDTTPREFKDAVLASGRHGPICSAR